MRTLLVRFVREDAGQDLVEYAFLIVFVALIAAWGLQALGAGLDGLFDLIAAAVSGVSPGLPPTT